MSLHPQQMKSLELLPKETGVVLFTRHSIREDASNDMPGYDTPLTPEGVKVANAWGAALPLKISAVYSSHSPRCIHTGEAMIQGAKAAANVIVHEQLCEPGVYVSKMSLAGPTFVKVGPIEFVTRTLNNTVEGTFEAREGTRRLLDLFLKVQPGIGEISLCITHDTILSSFVYELAGKKKLQRQDWPWMLEGVFLWIEEDYIHWIWRGVYSRTPRLKYFEK
jgi:broad specificity phosphatase PhoE